MPALLAISRVDVAEYVDTLFTVYIVLIFIRIIVGYFQNIPYNPVLSAVLGFIRDVTEPYLGLFRRFIPPARLGSVALDLSPIVAVFVLLILEAIIVRLIAG